MVKYSEIAETVVNIQEIKATLQEYFKTDGEVSIDHEGFVTVNGKCKLIEPCKVLPVKFKLTTGDFNCSENKLTSLAGCPTTVGGNFDCSKNNLTSLSGCPTSVGGSFVCSYNRLISLVGAPQTVDGHFSCRINKLESLVGAPVVVNYDFYCDGNKLTSLEGLPKTIGGLTGITLSPDVPVLRLLGYSLATVPRSSRAVANIISKYRGNTSRSSIIACQNELIAAGFESNARW